MEQQEPRSGGARKASTASPEGGRLLAQRREPWDDAQYTLPGTLPRVTFWRPWQGGTDLWVAVFPRARAAGLGSAALRARGVSLRRVGSWIGWLVFELGAERV